MSLLFVVAMGLSACKKQRSEPSSDQPDSEEWLPGVSVPSEKLLDRLQQAVRARSASLEVYTQHKSPDGTPRFTNRLALATSPYLQQHSHNPVNWFEYGDEALDRAKKLNRPIFLSIGYSTCHWCHVMARESFEDVEIARYLNEHYVAIKVDREQRPDLDAIFLRALEALDARGGWPLNVWLTPDGQPFFGGTYFPPRDGDRGARVGFLSLLRRSADAYREDGSKVVQFAADVVKKIRQPEQMQAGDQSPLDARAIHDAIDKFKKFKDGDNGGLRLPGQRSKFPASLPVSFLLRYHARTGDKELWEHARLTLDKMAAGGIRDHIGGGFHRYATDMRWLVPHFEKMLYDQAQLIRAYLDGYQAIGDPRFADIVKEIIDFAELELGAPDGGFYAALDADSKDLQGKRVEGWYYTWTPAEIEHVVGPKLAQVATVRWGVSKAGNYKGRSVVSLARSKDDVAEVLGLSRSQVATSMSHTIKALKNQRSKRPAPHRDEKIIVAWNGLMVSALARAAAVLEPGQADSRYRRLAVVCADRLLASRDPQGRLPRIVIADKASAGDGFLEDHAAVLMAALDLFELTGDVRWLDEALRIEAVMARRFEDPAGGFFLSSKDDAGLVRSKPIKDGPTPSGNALAVQALLRLHAMTGHDEYRKRAEHALRAFARRLEAEPTQSADLLLALSWALDEPLQVVLVANQSLDELVGFRKMLSDKLAPVHVVIPVVTDEVDSLATRLPIVEGKIARKDRATAYVCVRNACRLPTSDPAVFARQIKTAKPLSRP